MEPLSTTASNPPTKQNIHWVIAARVVVMAAFLDLFMQFPVIAPYARNIGATGILVGVIVATYSGANLVGNLVAGVILDRWGRKVPLMVGLPATALALFGYALATTPQQLLVVRSLHGLTAAVLTPGGFAIIGDSTRAGQRGHAMGISGAFIAIAAVIGPLIAGVVRDKQGPEAVFILSASIILVAFVLFWYSLRKLAWVSEEALSQGHSISKVSSWRISKLATSYIGTLTLTIGLGTLVTHLPIILSGRGEPAMRIGLTFTSFAIFAMIAMASSLSRVSDRLGRLIPMIAGLVSISVGMFVLWLSRGFFGSILGMGIFGLGFGVLFPAITALAADSVQSHQRGRAFGVLYAVFSVGVVIGSMVSGLLTQRLGELTLLPYLFSGVVALATILAISIIWRLQKRQPTYSRT